MLPWWGWLLLWVLIVLGGAALVGRRVRTAWRSAKALTTEVGRAGAVLAELEQQVERVREADDAPTAVTQDPHSLRAQYESSRAEQAAARSARRAARMPPWARVD